MDGTKNINMAKMGTRPFSSIIDDTSSLLCFTQESSQLGSSIFPGPTFPRNSSFPGKCLHFDRFLSFISLSGAHDQNPSEELAGVLMDAYRLGNRQTFNVGAHMQKCAGDEEKMLILYFNRIGRPSSLPTTEKESFVKNVLRKMLATIWSLSFQLIHWLCCTIMRVIDTTVAFLED
ncbi:hypothetical protein M0R45_013899 [Rubus argutus]|uniref:Uncharacterized protein n=1 Tax=Rubus argutus TaxID=59490 RepID=A0AAW1XN94_RUBAR